LISTFGEKESTMGMLSLVPVTLRFR